MRNMQGARTSGERTKMSMRMDPEELPRPHQIYKCEFMERILNLSPTSILDVGCGEAQVLRAAASAGCESCVGIEVDESLVSKHRNEGLDVRLGRAETLPFADKSFDVVTFDYVAHHLEHLERALLEAARVGSGRRVRSGSLVRRHYWLSAGRPGF
jgi:ubiquinone/menaquinone biosynthesis C-methylase UbiE